MTAYAKEERQALADLMVAAGPHAPTMCEGWDVADLAAHLVVRETRPDAGIGILLPAFRSYAERVRRQARDAAPWPATVDRFRAGPPPLLRPVDEQMNAMELFVHYEDVHRAAPGWEPRELSDGERRALWRRVSSLRRLVRFRVRTGLTVVAPGWGSAVVRSGEPHATVTGAPEELILFLTGRRSSARVELSGDAEAIERLTEAHLAI